VAHPRVRKRTVKPTSPDGSRPPDQEAGPAADGVSVPALLARATDEAASLLGADGAFLYLLDPTSGKLRLTHDAGVRSLARRPWFRRLELPLGVGMFGRSVEQRRVIVTGDYPADESFVHSDAPDRIVDELEIRSLVVAPLAAGDEVFGALGTFSRQPNAFAAPEIALVRALADHAALAMANAQLIDQLARSREALERQAVIERSLRELGTRISGARDPGSVVQFTIDEARRLLHGDGARIDIVDPQANQLRGLFSSGDEKILETEWPRDPNDRLEVGASGRAVLTGQTYITGDYLADESIIHSIGPDTYVRSKGIRAVIATPLNGDQGPFGAITVWSTRPDAFGPDDSTLLETIAGQSAVALGRARLIEELGRSREMLARRAEEERTLREIARRLMTIQSPGELLQDVVNEAARLLGSSGAVIDLLDPATGEVRWAHDAGIDDPTRAEWQGRAAGVDGVLLAIRERRVIVTDDYANDARFADATRNRAFLEAAGIRSIAFAPLIGEATVLGTLAVFAEEPGRFGEQQAALLGALADLATIAIHNAELVAELGRSREETARRAETERTLREIAARVTAIRDPDTILGLIVDEARRVLGSDGAHLTRMSEDRTFLRPVVVAGGMDDETREWLRSQQFPLDGGINGLAAAQGRVVWTPSYSTDPRIPRDRDDLEVAGRMGLGAMASAPLRAPGGEVIGTLAISYRKPGPIPPDRLATLQALADHAAIAVSNSDLLARLEASESSYRALVQASPDVIWQNDAEGRFTFFADTAEALFGYSPSEMVGQHFSFVVADESMDLATRAWADLHDPATRTLRLRFVLRRKDGGFVPSELSAVGVFEDGRFVGGQGTIRDISERERLEAELRASEERYRFLVEHSPDVIYATDADGRITYFSESVERVLGWTPAEVVGRHFRDIIRTPSGSPVGVRFNELAHGLSDTVARMELIDRKGRYHPFEVTASAIRHDGVFGGVHGAARDIGERERLERELRESEGRYRYLVQASPDLVWMTDQDGRFTFVSDQARTILGWEPVDLLGRSFADLAPRGSRRGAVARFRWLQRRPTEVHRSRLKVLTLDGRERAMEITGIGMVADDGQFLGAHGAARDVSERDRLEADLRRQAAELASSEERSHLARELHDSVTQALFSMTLLSRSAELLFQKDPSQVPAKLAALRELQRDALAEMRALIFELRPGNIVENGLIQGLRTHSAALSGRIGLPVVVESDLTDRPPIQVEETLYRIAQEALHNVVKHASARQVRLEVGRVADGVRLRVIDDGRGFDPSGVPDGHLGITGMRSRAERLGGRLTVSSAAGRGTTIEVVVPEPRRVEAASGEPEA